MVKKSTMREDDDVIIVENVTKKYAIPHERRTTLFEGIAGVFKPNTYETFTALDNVSFRVKRGESIGIIGDNGCGKSTLLKIIAGILKPSMGTVTVRGRITPFLELGVGFQPDLTARENIEVYSTIMGLSNREIEENLDSVLEFAGLTKFRDTKLKNFSSGMQVRLAFATAIQREPEVLIVDEVLAVGDMDFQQKCLDIFTGYREKNVTILFVSHDLSSVRRFCDKTLLMKAGKVIAFGPTVEVLDRYIYGLDKVSPSTPASVSNPQQSQMNDDNNQSTDTTSEPAASNATLCMDRWGNGRVLITDVKLFDKFGNESAKFTTGDTLKIRVSYRSDEKISDVVFGIAIYSDTDVLCYGTNTDIESIDIGTVDGEGTIEIDIPHLYLSSGKYLITLAAHSTDHTPYDWLNKKYSFNMINTGRIAGMFDLNSKWKKL